MTKRKKVEEPKGEVCVLYTGPGASNVNAMLQEANTFVNKNKNYGKALLLLLDDEKDNYSTMFFNSGLQCSEMLSLCESHKHKILKRIFSS